MVCERKRGETYDSEFARLGHGGQVRWVLVHEGKVEVSGRQATEGADEGEEDDEEGYVGAEGADEKDKADKACILCQFSLDAACVAKGRGP